MSFKPFGIGFLSFSSSPSSPKNLRICWAAFSFCLSFFLLLFSSFARRRIFFFFFFFFFFLFFFFFFCFFSISFKPFGIGLLSFSSSPSSPKIFSNFLSFFFFFLFLFFFFFFFAFASMSFPH